MPSNTFAILKRGLGRRCPQCGQGRLFAGWWQMEEDCPHCGLKIAAREHDTWAFMYLSTAFITGLFILTMLLVLPTNLWVGRTLVALAALGLFVLSAPYRKGLAIALDYWVELRWNNHGHLAYRADAKTKGKQEGIDSFRPLT